MHSIPVSGRRSRGNKLIRVEFIKREMQFFILRAGYILHIKIKKKVLHLPYGDDIITIVRYW